MGASGILLARDRREDGAPHWHGVVTVPQEGDRARVRDRVARAWQDAAYATAACIDIVTVTGWDAFAANEKIGHIARLFGHHFKLGRLMASDVDRFIEQRRGEGVTDHTSKKELVKLGQALKAREARGDLGGRRRQGDASSFRAEVQAEENVPDEGRATALAPQASA